MSPTDRQRPPSDPPPRARGLDQVIDRLHALEVTEEVRHAETTQRLASGAETFSELKKELKELRPKRAPLLAAAGFVLTVLLVVVSIVNTASTYVDRATLERTVERLQAQDTELRDELLAAKSALLRLQIELEHLKKGPVP